MVMFLGVIQANVLELVVMAIAALFVKCCRPRDTATAPSDNLTVILNYNLLALSEEDVDETFDTMFRAYMSNLSPHVAAVLVSATREPRLKRLQLQLCFYQICKVYFTLISISLFVDMKCL